jgi:pimeloyl-ACP methyl ester carboxylesterase
VLVHGAAGSADANWVHLVEGFAADRTVVRPDYAGSGATRDHGGRLELDELVAQVAAAAEDAGAVPFELVGFSLGAAVAASLAAQRPDLVRSLVLLGGFASTTADARSQIQFSLWRRMFDTDRDVLARLGVLTGVSPAFLAGMTPAELEEARPSRSGPPSPGSLSRKAAAHSSSACRKLTARSRAVATAKACQPQAAPAISGPSQESQHRARALEARGPAVANAPGLLAAIATSARAPLRSV